MKSGPSKKSAFLSEQELIYLDALSEKDPLILKILDFYKNHSRKGVDVFVKAMNQSLYMMGLKIEELSDIDFSETKSAAEMDKYELLLRISKDGMAIAKTLKEIERSDNTARALNHRREANGQLSLDTVEGSSEDELEPGDELLDPNNLEHQRSIIDVLADKERKKIKNDAGQE